MKILNLYPGIGGNRKFWGDDHDITAVEINPKIAKVYSKYFPRDKMIIGDAHQYLIENYHLFDFIWSSPPCQSHSKMARVNHKRYNLRQYPKMELWQEIIFLTAFSNKILFVVENVNPYYQVFIPPYVKIGRHLFWSNFKINNYKIEELSNFIDSKFEDIKTWLGFNNFNERIYLNKNHDYSQILRNCVHPEIGLHILNCAINKYNYKPVQNELFK
jgi:DNA (cytosine-5)-methyltransferase 1